MAGTSEVLQEYLVALGFKTDVISLRKFEDQLGATGKKVFGFGASVAGVVAGVEAATAAFAYSMRKNFFAADLAGSTVQRMQALTFAGKQFGISADAMEGSVANLARAFRLNPGMRSYAESLTHISTAGRDTTDVMLDLVRSTKGMDEFIGANIMQQFGMGADEYHQMREHIDEIREAQEKAAATQKRYGIDMEQQRKNTMAYATSLDLLNLRLSAMTQEVTSSFLPNFIALNNVVGDAADWWADWARGINKVSDLFSNFEVKPIVASVKELFGFGEKPNAAAPKKIPNKPGNDKIDLFQSYGWSREQSAGIVANLNRESGMTANAVGDNGAAYGVAQWHADRQAKFKEWAGKDIHNSTLAEQLQFVDYELRHGEKKAGNLLGNARTPDEAARLVSHYYERPAATEAEAALRGTEATRLYNGQGQVPALHSNVVINVNGSDAASTAKAVAGQQTRVLGDATRMLKGGHS